MTLGLRAWVCVVAVNAVFAFGAVLLARSEPGTTADRVGYEYVGQRGLAPDCPHSIFCYRVLVPVAVEQVSLSPIARWRAFAALANVLTGVVLGAIAIVSRRTSRPLLAALLAGVLYQTSFGATFAVFDPFTPDPAVYFAAAALTLCWLRDRPVAAAIIAWVGVFAKETVALVALIVAAADFVDRGGRRPGPWVLIGAGSSVLVVAFHLVMNYAAGWSERGSASADFAGGAWLARWLADPTLTSATRVFYVFIPFAFVWLYAALGLLVATPRLRRLAVVAAILLPPLLYVQTAERALATASFVVVPLAALFLARTPPGLGLAAAASNSLLTLRVGLSVAWLPPVPYLLAVAGGLAAVTAWRGWMDARTPSTAPSGASVVASAK